MREPIACLGAGRMGRGIAVVFAYAGHKVALVDFKPRDEAAFKTLSDGRARMKWRGTLATLAGLRPVDPARRSKADGRACRPSLRAGAQAVLVVRLGSFSRVCRKCPTSSARYWRVHQGSRDQRRSSPRPPRRSWWTILGRRRTAGTIPQRALAQSGVSRAAGRGVARRRTPIRRSPRASNRCSRGSERCRSFARHGPATSCRASRRWR